MRRHQKEYWVWADMVSRCKNKNHRAYKNYGGRGITVDPKWLTFDGFAEDMLPRPPGMTLDRIDNNAGYSKENCRWSDRKTQNSNRRNCIYVMHNAEPVTLKEYCRREGIRYRPVVTRIQDLGWSVNEALKIPVGASRSTIKAMRKRCKKEVS